LARIFPEAAAGLSCLVPAFTAYWRQMTPISTPWPTISKVIESSVLGWRKARDSGRGQLP
jgi:hypothetical protein